MEKLDLRWAVFEYCNIDKTQAFENMCRRLFTEEFLKGKTIPHSDHKTPGIEVIPVLEPNREDGKPSKRISFQSKYHGNVSDAYRKFKESAEITVKKWQGRLDLVYLFCNRTLTTESSNYKEIVSILSKGGIEAVPISDTDLLDLAAKYSNIAKDYFISKSNKPDVPPALTTIPFPPDKLIGREIAIEEIQGLLAKHNIVSIHADGGVGKTAIATKIINQIKDEISCGKSSFKHIAWITSTGNLKSDLIGLSIPMVDTMKSQEEKYQIVSSYLQSNPTFLVIDNMDELPKREDSKELNTITGQTKVLITSRADIPYAEEYPLVDLDPDSALALHYQHFTRKQMTIEQIRDQKDHSYGEKIVKAAAYNALFIELIGKMAYSDHWKLDSLWEKLSVNVFGVDSKHPIKSIHGDGKLLEHIQKLYEMSNLSDRQKEIMSFIALFPAECSIFFDVFEWAGFEDDEEDNLGALQDRGWIVRDDEGYLIHTMVKGSIELQNKETKIDISKYHSLISNLIKVDQYMPVTLGYKRVRERIVVLETVCRLVQNDEIESKQYESLINSLAGVYEEQGDFKNAIKYYKMLFEANEKKTIMIHQNSMKRLNNIEIVYDDNGLFKEIVDYSSSIDFVQWKANLTSTYTPIECSNIARILCIHSDFQLALEFCEKALAVEKTVLKECPAAALIYNNLAAVFFAQGDYLKAIDYYGKAVVIKQKEYGSEHPSTASTLNNLGDSYFVQGDPQNALEYYQKAVMIKDRIFGLAHPSTGMTFNKYLENVKADINKRTKIQDNVFWIERLFIAKIFYNIAKVYESMNDYDKALDNFINSVGVFEMVQGGRSSSISVIYKTIADIYETKDDYEMTLKNIKSALMIPRSEGRDEQIKTAMKCELLGDLNCYNGDYSSALEEYIKALEIREKVLGSEHPSVATVYKKIGKMYSKQSKFVKAQESYKKAIKYFEKALGSEHPSTAEAFDEIANVYKKQKNYVVALEYYEKALSIRTKTLGSDNNKTKETQSSISFIKEILNKDIG